MRRKKENKQEADHKGKERIKKYESRQEKKEVKKEEKDDDGTRSILCYRKVEGGEWEPFHYTYRVSNSRPRKTNVPEPESSGTDDSESKD